MADSPHPKSPGNEEANATSPAELAGSIRTILADRPQTVVTLFQAFVGSVDPNARGRKQLSDELLNAAMAFDNKQEDHAHVQRLFQLAVVGVLVLAAIVGTLVLVGLVRDHADLVKTIFDGVALILSHGAVGAGGYLIGKARRRPRGE